jgi:hypothetical protein
MNQVEDCIFCHQSLGEGDVVTLTSKGCESIAQAVEKRGVDIHTEPNQQVHTQCRRVYCNVYSIAAAIRKRTFESTTDLCTLRSTEPLFNHKEHCIFCGSPDTYDHRKMYDHRTIGHKLVKILTSEFHGEINKLCDTRKDTWSDTVKGRINSVNDLFAADAVYHQVCSVNFRTNKSIPRQFTSEHPSQAKLGRPRDTSQVEAFLKVTEYLLENDDEQTTITYLIKKMREYLGYNSTYPPYHFTYMKDQLKKQFGDKIVIAEINGKSNVVTLRSTASTILHDFYHQPKQVSSTDDKLRIIETAAKLIKSDIQEVNQTNDSYASCHELSSVEEAMSYLPESLKLLLTVLFRSKDREVKLASLGRAIMQAIRPRVLLAPLQVGLGVQLHHHFASKSLIDSLHKHGFCCSYSESHKV